MDTIEHRRHTGTVEYSEDDNCFFGKVTNIRKSSITYEGKTILELVSDFNAAIDDYIIECEENGVEPEEPDEFKRCCNCGKQMNMTKNEYKTIMHNGMHYYVCSEKCMYEYYK